MILPFPSVQAQPGPRIGYVYPPGGRQGATFQVTVGGQNLGAVSNAFISGAGVQATVLEYNRPMPQNEFNMLRDELRVLQDKRAAFYQSQRRRDRQGSSPASTNTWTGADEKRLTKIRAKTIKNPPNRQASPAIAETVTLKVTVAPDAESSDREIRLGAPFGLSNPMRFCIGQLPEFSKPPIRAANPDLDRFLERLGRPPASSSNKFEMSVTLPAIANGQIPPGGVDRFRFRARQGQQLVVAASARELIPYLADAVPGWFQATLALHDAKGRELAYDDDFRFHPDPVLRFQIPKDGEYAIEIKDAIYRGREDFVYRITLGEVPFVTSIFPLGGPAGEQAKVELMGWNLPTNRLTVGATDKVPGVRLISVTKDEHISNLVPFAVDTLPECAEIEPNNDPKSAQKVTLPIIVNGRISEPGDADVFRFEGRAGDEIVAEVTARRLDSPLDSVLRLTDAAGTQLAFNDDYEDKGSGLNTHHADSYLRATLPADGTYFVRLGDVQRQGGPEYAYRLRLSAPRPDFELRVVPASLGIRGGASLPLTAHVLRRDGFTNAVTLALKDAPPGFKLSGAQVTTNQDQLRFTLTAPAADSNDLVRLTLEGRAKIAGREIVHPAVPAEDMMQAFAYRHLVPAKELAVAVSGRWAQWAAVRILSSTPVKIPAGGTNRVRVGMPPETPRGRVELELSDPPEGLTIKEVVPAGAWATEIVLQCDAEKAKPGLKGNLIINAFPPRAGQPGRPIRAANQRRIPLTTLPAIPFEIVSP
jgi:hypothetical protein